MSLMTNSTAASALSLLRGGQTIQDKNIGRLASGKEVETAQDNAAFWAIAKMMDSTRVSMHASQDAIGFSQAITDVTSMGVSAATDLVTEIRSKLILAASMPNGRQAVNTEITALKSQLQSVAEASGFAGQNWLKIDAGETPGIKSLVSSVTTDEGGNATVNTIDVDTTGLVLTSGGTADDGLLTAGTGVTTDKGGSYTFHLLDVGSITGAPGSTEIGVDDTNTVDEINGMIAATDMILGGLTDAGARLGATLSSLGAQDSFLADLSDAITRGIGSLVDADAEETATRVRSGEVQQKLQAQMLNIANANSSHITQLFR